jgi:hypothetical protein
MQFSTRPSSVQPGRSNRVPTLNQNQLKQEQQKQQDSNSSSTSLHSSVDSTNNSPPLSPSPSMSRVSSVQPGRQSSRLPTYIQNKENEKVNEEVKQSSPIKESQEQTITSNIEKQEEIKNENSPNQLKEEIGQVTTTKPIESIPLTTTKTEELDKYIMCKCRQPYSREKRFCPVCLILFY